MVNLFMHSRGGGRGPVEPIEVGDHEFTRRHVGCPEMEIRCHSEARRDEPRRGRFAMNDVRRVDTLGVPGALDSSEIADGHARVARAQWSRRQGPPIPATLDGGGGGMMAAAYGHGLADGQAGLTYQVPSASDGRVRFAGCYRHGYEHGAAIRARKLAT
jgi:hypothetical protein